jgi:hypothetical protein
MYKTPETKIKTKLRSPSPRAKLYRPSDRHQTPEIQNFQNQEILSHCTQNSNSQGAPKA